MRTTNKNEHAGTGIKVVAQARPTLFLETLATALRVRGHVVQATSRDALTASDLVARLDPDVCILDAVEGSDCLEAARRVRTGAPAVKVLLLSTEPSQRIEHAYDQHIVDAVVDRSCDFGQLEAALVCTVRGQRCRPRGHPAPPPSPESATVLTIRERQVLERLVRGASTYAIAEELRISPHTVRTHVQALMRKLEVHGRGRAVSVALARNLLAARSG